MTDELSVRRAEASDLPAVLQLLRDSMGRADDPRFEALFRWKHFENGFGPSPIWVACDGEQIVALRTLMRWEFERGDSTFRCVRAVDTATHPDYQGRGLFRRLTLDALPELEADGVAFVFNTPNDSSRPGYLKMGWSAVGTVRACVRPFSVGGAVRLARNRVPALHFSDDVAFGVPAAEALADTPALDRLLASRAPSALLRTRWDAARLRWRYGTDLLGYRAIAAPGGIDGGLALVRVRRRGSARELVVASLLVPGDDPAARRALVRRVRRAAHAAADYALAAGAVPGFLRANAVGPVVTTRSLAITAPASVAEFDFAMGDIELF
jgi:hypothetical protein